MAPKKGGGSRGASSSSRGGSSRRRGSRGGMPRSDVARASAEAPANVPVISGQPYDPPP